jgi:hypothetical protein
MQFMRAQGLVAMLAACQGGSSDAPRQMSTPEPPPALNPDAAIPTAPAPGAPAEEAGSTGPGGIPAPALPVPRAGPRARRFVQLTLRSTPGATVYLDGERTASRPPLGRMTPGRAISPSLAATSP